MFTFALVLGKFCCGCYMRNNIQVWVREDEKEVWSPRRSHIKVDKLYAFSEIQNWRQTQRYFKNYWLSWDYRTNTKSKFHIISSVLSESETGALFYFNIKKFAVRMGSWYSNIIPFSQFHIHIITLDYASLQLNN